MQEEFTRIVPGDTISYRMRVADRPINPLRAWKGQVISIDRSINRVTVAVLDEGYEGESEYIGREQIILAERRMPQRVEMHKS